jgi:NAD(P)-dependent dehydrogenase (short-subunit alcohol dehydrogenase family)
LGVLDNKVAIVTGAASKAGPINPVQVAATQLAGSNVRVNAICPVSLPFSVQDYGRTSA